MRAMRAALFATVGLAVAAVLVVAVGYSLPEGHRATVRAHYRQSVDIVHRAIVDVSAAPSWRTGVDSVRILTEQPLRWREHSATGTLTMEMVETTSTRVVSRIVDTGQGFGGTWTFEIVPHANGTTLTITEDGEVYSPLFRVMSRFVFGHYSGLENYAADLGRRFGEDVQAVRVGD